MAKQLLINDIQLPRPLFDAMSNDEYSPGNSDYTPSSLGQGTKEYWGKRRNKGLKRYASKSWAAFTGTAMHKGLEYMLRSIYKCDLYGKIFESMDPCREAITKDITDCKDCPYIKVIKLSVYRTEVHLEVNFNGVAKTLRLPEEKIIGGTIDLIEIDNEIIIWDYKTMSTTQFIDEEKVREWTIKGNIYVWLLMMTKTIPKIDHLRYIPIFKDWTTTKAERLRDVNDIPAPTIPLEIWSRAKIEQFIYDQVIRHEACKDTPLDEIPYCTMEERWEKPTQYKALKFTDGIPGKKASAVKPTQEEIIGFINSKKPKKNELYIYKEFKGKPTRCMGWCDLGNNGLCNYKQLYLDSLKTTTFEDDTEE